MRVAVFTKNFSNPAYAAARLGAERAAAPFGAELRHYVPQTPDDPAEQSALIDEALAAKPDAIVLSPVHATQVDPAIRRIAEAGIPLFAFVNPVDAVPCVSYVGADDGQLAREVAGRLFDHLGGRGRILAVSGHAHSVTSLARMAGFDAAAAAAAGVEIVARLVGDYQRETARRVVADWLAAPDCAAAIDGVLVANDIMALGVLDALRSAGQRAAVVGVNAIPDAIRAILAGEMLASADFNAMQMAAVITECAVRHLRGERVPAHIDLPVVLVDRGNAHLWDLPYEQRPLKTLQEVLR